MKIYRFIRKKDLFTINRYLYEIYIHNCRCVFTSNKKELKRIKKENTILKRLMKKIEKEVK